MRDAMRLVLAAAFAVALAATGGLAQQGDLCNVDPTVSGCPQPGPVPVPEPVEGMAWTQGTTYLLLALIALLTVLKWAGVWDFLLGVLDVALMRLKSNQRDRARWGHTHRAHHKRERQGRKPEDQEPRSRDRA